MFGNYKVLLACLALSACHTTGEVIHLPGQIFAKVEPTYALGSRVPDKIIKLAEDTYLYAQMAYNAYDLKDQSLIKLPDGIQPIELSISEELDRQNQETGLAFKLYEWDKGEEKNEIVIAFRGSERNYKDWVVGNIRGKQAPLSVHLYDEVLKKYPDHPIAVTGDSLGGSLATQVSLCRDIVISVSLNTSPRFSRKHCADFVTQDKDPNAGKRHSITERGEILKVLRIPGREATQLYTSVNCIPGWSFFRQHDVRDLAHCITEIASYQNDGARRSLTINRELFGPKIEIH